MIGAAREWLVSIVMLSFLISLLRLLLPEGNLRKVGAFTGGLVLMAAILYPLARLEPVWPEWSPEAYENAVNERMEELNAAEENSFRQQVSERTAALIQAKASELGLTVSASVDTRMERGAPIPWAVTLDVTRDAFTPDGTREGSLSAWLDAALNIPPERQFWTPAET